MLVESKEIESNLRVELEKIASNMQSEREQYYTFKGDQNNSRTRKHHNPTSNASKGLNLNFGSSLASKTYDMSSERNRDYRLNDIPKHSDRSQDLAHSLSSPSFGVRGFNAQKNPGKENLIKVYIAGDSSSGRRPNYRRTGQRTTEDVMARLRSQLATLPQTDGVTKFSASLYPPFKHESRKGLQDVRELIEEDTNGRLSSDKIFGYVDDRYMEAYRDGLEVDRKGLGTMHGGSDTLVNRSKHSSNNKLYCEFAKTALNLMSVLEEGDSLVRRDDWADIPRDTYLEDQVLEIKSKYCCTQP